MRHLFPTPLHPSDGALVRFPSVPIIVLLNVCRVRLSRLGVGLVRWLKRVVSGLVGRKPAPGCSRGPVAGLLAAFAFFCGGQLVASTSYPRGIVPVEAAAPPAKSVLSKKTYGKVVRMTLTPLELDGAMEFSLSLPLRNRAELEARIARGEVLSGAALEPYLPTAEDYAEVRAWLGAQGFAVSLDAGTRHAVFARGSVSRVSANLNVTMARVATPDGEFTSAVTAPELPDDIGRLVDGIRGLQPHLIRHPHQRHGQQLEANTYYAITPAAVAAVYQTPSNLNGAGQTIAIIGDSSVTLSDMNAFWLECGIPQSWNNITQLNVGAGPGSSTTNQSEVSMDVQWTSGLAPAAQVRVYETAYPMTGLHEAAAYTQILNDLPSNPTLHQVTESYGGTEYGDEQTNGDTALVLLAAQGVTCFASSGDGGSNPDTSPTTNAYNAGSPIAVSYPASDPYMTAVGGTTLRFPQSLNGQSSPPEVAWSVGATGSYGTGGGYSSVFSRPSWQTAPGLSGGGMRAIPDISALADTGSGDTDMGPLFVQGGAAYIGSGTSLSSPIWAGLCALINQSRANAGSGPVGYLNPQLYALAGSNGVTDITSGSNGAYSAGSGYDLCTGLGTPLVGNLITLLSAPPAQHAPGFSTNPANRTVFPGQSATFTVVASGSPAPTYQWQRQPAGSGIWSDVGNGSSYSGATTNSLTVSNVTLAMDGDQLRCVATNNSGNATSNAALLSVPVPAGFTSRPLTRSLIVGDSYTFQAPATGTGSLIYQWRRNGQVINGATAASFTISSAALSDNGFYEVIVTDANGAAHSFFQLHVSPPGLAVTGWGYNQFGQTTTPAGLTSVVAVAGGATHSLALKSDGTVVAWSTSGYPETIVPAGLTGVVAIAAKGNTSMALKTDGTIMVWGANNQGQSTVPANLTGVIAVAAGEQHCLALKADGTVVAWGDSSWGKTTIPAGLSGVVAVDAGVDHSLALKSDGTVVVWGSNFNNPPVTPPVGLNGVAAIAAGGFQDLALKTNGTVVGWGANFSGEATPPAGLSGVVAIASGTSQGLALKANGSVVVWGNNFYGQSTVPAGLGTVYGIGAGDSHDLALVAPVAVAITSQPVSQTVNAGSTITLSVTATGIPTPTFQWRKNGSPLANDSRITGATSPTLSITGAQAGDADTYDVVVSNIAGTTTSQPAVLTVRLLPQLLVRPLTRLVAAGQPITLDVTAQGAGTYTWIHNGQVLSATGAQLAIASAAAGDAGYYEARITNPAGTVRTLFYVRVAQANVITTWGANDYGQSTVPAGLADVADISAGLAHALALRPDGTVVAWGRDDSGQTDVPVGLGNVVQVSAGAYHSVALKSDGTVVAWGLNASGQCNVPVGLSGVVFVSAGGSHTVALKNDGTMVAWGDNTNGQCILPGNIRFAHYVSAGLTHNVALTDLGMQAWGRNNAGQSTVPSLSDAVTVQAGEDYTIYVDSRGEVIYWGNAPLYFSYTNAATISTRKQHGLVLKNDGTVAAWGPNVSGENVMPTGLGIVQAVAAGEACSLVLVARIPPAILTQPASQTVSTGANAVFSVSASGASTYRWMKGGVDLSDGGNIGGAASATLTISNAQVADAGNYSVRVGNGFGQVTSQSAVLTVQSILVTNNGGVTANADGSQVSLSVNVQGLGSFTYQWYFGQSGDTSNPVAGATSATLTAPQTGAQDYYWVRVSNGSTSTDSAAIPVGKWTLIDPLFGSAGLSATAYGAGKYVVVGTTAGYSTNAINWKVGTIDTGADLHTAFYDGTRFVAGGVRGQVFASADGSVWQNQRQADPGQYSENVLISTAYGNGITVMAGARSQIMSSTDGSTWAWRPVGVNGEIIDLLSVAFGGGRFVAAGQNASTYQPMIYQSVDGINWSPCAFSLTPFSNSYALNGLSQVVYSGGRFVALGQTQNTGNPAYYMTSTDGLTWTVPAFTNVPVGVSLMTSGGGLLLSGDLRTSADGINWSAPHATVAQYPQQQTALGYGNGVFLRLNGPYDANYSSIITSTDLTNWTTRVGVGVPGNVTYGNGRFVGVARNRIGYSFDGLNWIVTANSTTDFGRVSFGNGLFVSVSTYTGYGISHFTSTDGVTWTPQRSAISGNPLSFSIIFYAGGQWVGTNGGAIFTSPDTLTWTQRFYNGSNGISAMTYGGGHYVAVGYNGSVVISDDGFAWSTPPRPTTQNFLKVAYGAGRFVASDGASGLWSSLDGTQWTPQVVPAKSGGAYSGYISSLTFGGGHFRASYGNDILSSDDGVVWQVTPGALVSALNQTFDGDLLYAGGSFWAVSSVSGYGIGWWRAPTGPGAPGLVSAPADTLVANGGAATLTVSATGNSLSYQWYLGSTGDTAQPITGATGSSYTTPLLTQSGHFWVRVTGPGGYVDSPTVTVAIAMPPVISTQPADTDIVAGASANLSVTATGLPAPTYQWYAGRTGDTSQPVANATAGSLTVSAPPASVRFWVRVSNSAGSVDSEAAVVTPWFERTDIKNKQLGGVAYGAGRWVVSGFGSNDFYSADGATWNATADSFGGQSGGEVTYGNGVFIGTDSDRVGALWRSTDGSHWLQIFVPAATSQFGSVAYVGGLLFALASNGQFATSLDGANWTLRSVGYSAWLSDVAYGNGTFVMAAGSKTYTSSDLVTWREAPVVDTDTRITSLVFGAGKFVGVGGANQGKILVSADGVTWTQSYVYNSNGVYDIAYDGSRFAVSAIDNIILSRDAVTWQLAPFPGTSQISAGAGSFLGVWQTGWQSAAEIPSGPHIGTQPVAQGAVLGQNVTLSVFATGGALSYQWRRNDVDIPGAQSATLSIVDFQAANAGRYTVVVTDSSGSVTSDPAIVTVVLPPQLLNQPQSVVVNAGQTAFFEVTVAGDAPSQYAWYLNGVLLPGRTDARLNFPAAQAADAGSYIVTVSNAAGSVASNAATLVVHVPPVIVQQPVSHAAIVGSTVSFTVVASSDTAISYVWQRSAGGVGPWAVVPFNSSYSGQLTNTLTVNAPTLANSGDKFSCIVVNVAGSVVTQPATLTVSAALGSLQVYGGYSHAQYRRADGTLWAMGGNYVGQLGDGTTTGRLVPVQSASAVVAAASGFEHSLFVKQDGTLWAMGDNQLSELGDGTTTPRSTPVQIATGVVAASAGYRHSLFRKSDGTLWGVGWNANGQLGDGTGTNRTTPVQVASHVADLVAGYQHSLFVKTDGTLWATGSNVFGQFGDGTTTSRTTPVQVGTNTATVASFYHTLILRTDGTLWAAGRNDRGELGDGTTTARSTPFQVAANVTAIAVGALHSVFLKADGTLWTMGANDRGELGNGTTTDHTTPVQVASGVVGISAGLLQTFFIKTDGSLWGAGANDQGQLGDGTTTDRSTPVQIASGGVGVPGIVTNPVATNSAAADRVQLTWTPVLGATSYEVWRSPGTDSAAATLLASGVKGAFYEDLSGTPGVGYYYWIKAVSPAGTSSFAFSAFGLQGVAAATLGITSQPVSQTVNVGDTVIFSVTPNGTAPFSYQWRKGGTPLADGGNVSGCTTATLTLTGVQAADAGSYDVVVVNGAGSVVSASALLSVTLVPAVVHASTGYKHSAFVRADGTLWTTGDNTYGQLGDGTQVARLSPVQVATNVAAVSAGTYNTVFLKADGTVWGMGWNFSGQLTAAAALNQTVPLQIDTGAVAVAVSGDTTVYLKADGTLWAVGLNNWDMLGTATVGSFVSATTPTMFATGVASFSIGDRQTMYVRRDGTLWTAGYSRQGQLGTVGDVTSFLQLATGVRFASVSGGASFFEKSDGTVWGTGVNSSGQLGNGTLLNASAPVQILAGGIRSLDASAGYFSLFLEDDGTLLATGDNSGGNFGDGTAGIRTVPASIATGIAAMSGSQYHLLYLKDDGSLWASGDNDAGQLGNGSSAWISLAVRIAGGQFQTPTAPANITASLETLDSSVLVSWGFSVDASYYQVWRSADSNPANAVKIADHLTVPLFYDTGLAGRVSHYYWARAVNTAGASAFSSAASGVAGAIPSITTQPQSQITQIGAGVVFTVTADGTAPLTYVWRHNGQAISGPAAVTLNLPNPLPGDAGSYDVVVSNSLGSVTSSTATLIVTKLDQSINFPVVSDLPFPGPGANYPVSNFNATASSGLPVSFQVVSGPASVSSGALLVAGTGPVTLRASQAGNASFNAAATVDRSFVITKAVVGVTLGNLSAIYDGAIHAVTATTVPAGPHVDFTYDGSATAPSNAGNYAVVATVNDSDYQGSATDTLVIAKADQTITFTGPANQPYSATPITLSATATSGLPVAFSVASGPATVSGTTLMLTGSGAVTVRASQAGDANRNAALNVDQSFTVAANFDSWAQSKFTTAELLDPSISGPNAIYGQDGLPNLLKYALGLEPKQNITSGLPAVSTTATDWVYTYTRPASITDVTYEVEVSTDLVNWSTAGITHELVSSDGTTDTWHGRYPLASATNVFFRLKVTR